MLTRPAGWIARPGDVPHLEEEVVPVDVSNISITGLGKSAGGSRMRRIINSKGMLVSIGLLVAVSVAACTAGKAPGSAEPDNGHTGTATVAASPPAATSIRDSVRRDLQMVTIHR